MGRTSALINILFPLVPMVFGLLLAVFPPNRHMASGYLLLPVVGCILGGALVFTAKVQRFRSGRWVSFGTGGLPRWARIAYFSGYVLLLIGTVSALAVVIR